MGTVRGVDYRSVDARSVYMKPRGSWLECVLKERERSDDVSIPTGVERAYH